MEGFGETPPSEVDTGREARGTKADERNRGRWTAAWGTSGKDRRPRRRDRAPGTAAGRVLTERRRGHGDAAAAVAAGLGGDGDVAAVSGAAGGETCHRPG